MAFISQPSKPEGIIIFGDGGEAVLDDVNPSSQKGYLSFHFRPTNKMRWKNQIQDSEYDRYDGKIKRIYKEDLCCPLSLTPKFPVWIIICDYRGNEDTPFMNHFVKLKLLLQRNRDLVQEINIWKIKVQKHRMDERRRVEHPDEADIRFADKVRMLNESNKQQQQKQDYFPPQQGEMNS